ncbi:CLUMA_CG004205, isoform A [Clunio marinus]|uniref:CLUMA_CG004205, isoform A n=1 Tax=Clunio marinus TaxID=568069 RepID=A0A1J1HQZ4_9DIPT|nr:CLUMA_CG004205, isoform A [Clunio marinus]
MAVTTLDIETSQLLFTEKNKKINVKNENTIYLKPFPVLMREEEKTSRIRLLFVLIWLSQEKLKHKAERNYKRSNDSSHIGMQLFTTINMNKIKAKENHHFHPLVYNQHREEEKKILTQIEDK